MPPVSQSQRRLVYAAAAKKGGIGGMSRKVARDFIAADNPGKLPEHRTAEEKVAKRYGKK